jgi:ankyrin repeat protein
MQASNNPQVSQILFAQIQELETSSRLQMCELPDDDCPKEQQLTANEATKLPESFFTNNVTPIAGPLVPVNRCTCQCHNEKYKALRSQLEVLLPPILSNITSRCTNFECCARRRSREKIIVTPNWLNKFGRFSATARKPVLRNSLILREVLTEGCDANRYAKTGNVEGLRRLIADGVATPSATTPDGWTLLHAAAYYSQLEVVKFLLNHKADPEASEDGKRKPADLARVRALMVGATKVQKEIANLFPSADSFQDDYELSPIHIAVLGLYDHDDKTRPDLCSLFNFIDDAEAAPTGTVWKTFGVEKRKTSPLFRKVVQFYADLTNEPVNFNATKLIDIPDKIHEWTPFLWACYTGRQEAMNTLIKNGADPFTLSEKSRNALHLASESRNPDVLSCVLAIPPFKDQWFTINHHDYWGETPLHVAASGSANCVAMLLERGADKNATQETKQVPLHYASLATDNREKLGIVDVLSADCGPHINSEDEENRTPIFDLLDSPLCVDMLIRRGADVTICDVNGKSILHHAAIENAADSLKIILASCSAALPTATDKNGDIPLSLAFKHSSTTCAKLLIEHDAIRGFPGKEGWALVHHAALWGDAEVLEAVLKHRSFRRGARTPDGASAADLAKSANKWYGRVRELLKEYDSKGQVAPSAHEAKASHVQARAEYMMTLG